MLFAVVSVWLTEDQKRQRQTETDFANLKEEIQADRRSDAESETGGLQCRQL